MIAAFGPAEEIVSKDNPLKCSNSLETKMRTVCLKEPLRHPRSVLLQLVGPLAFGQHSAIFELVFEPGEVPNKSYAVANVRRPEP